MGLNIIDPRNQSAETLAAQITHDSRRNFRYGNSDNPEQDGAPVLVPQNKYAYVAVIVSESQITEPEMTSLSQAIKNIAPNKITEVNVVKQYFIPSVSEEYNASLDGSLRIKYLPHPKRKRNKNKRHPRNRRNTASRVDIAIINDTNNAKYQQC